MSDNGFVTRESIRGRLKRQYQAVDVPSGLRFRLQTLSEGEQTEYEGFMAGILAVAKSKRPNYLAKIMREGRRRLLQLVLVDGEGVLLYGPEELETLAADIDANDATALFDAAKVFVGAESEQQLSSDVEGMVKNLLGTIGDGSP